MAYNLPPGVTSRMIDEAMGVEGPCDCCGCDIDHCICPECTVCETFGDPNCYPAHGLKYSPLQTLYQIRGAISLRATQQYHEKFGEES